MPSSTTKRLQQQRQRRDKARLDKILQHIDRLTSFHDTDTCMLRYVLVREAGRLRRQMGYNRQEAYSFLADVRNPALFPGCSRETAQQRMQRKLGNVDRQDDHGTRVIARASNTKVGRRVLLHWTLSRRLAPGFVARVGCVRAWTPKVQRSLQDAALREFMAHRSTLGIPGTHPSAVRASGANGSLHKLPRNQRNKEYRRLFRTAVLQPVTNTMNRESEILGLLSGKKRKYSELLGILKSVKGNGALRAGELVHTAFEVLC